MKINSLRYIYIPSTHAIRVNHARRHENHPLTPVKIPVGTFNNEITNDRRPEQTRITTRQLLIHSRPRDATKF